MSDFKSTMHEIIDVKNGVISTDSRFGGRAINHSFDNRLPFINAKGRKVNEPNLSLPVSTKNSMPTKNFLSVTSN